MSLNGSFKSIRHLPQKPGKFWTQISQSATSGEDLPQEKNICIGTDIFMVYWGV